MRPVLAVLISAWIAVATLRPGYPTPPAPSTRPATVRIDPDAVQRWHQAAAAARREGRPPPPLPAVSVEIDLRDWLPALRGEPTTRKAKEVK